ncbi:hypothetical protein BaRGS_00024384 [Batillaria attramentaria]|uniref:Secreted protein n=1 Tax=Batillaria attramentaria TaxID=370345 RepID=A0ABD0KBC0_9CAEN
MRHSTRQLLSCFVHIWLVTRLAAEGGELMGKRKLVTSLWQRDMNCQGLMLRQVVLLWSSLPHRQPLHWDETAPPLTYDGASSNLPPPPSYKFVQGQCYGIMSILRPATQRQLNLP